MLIDWVSMHINLSLLGDNARNVVRMMGDRVTRYCPRTGEISWETVCWDSVRSDSHQVIARSGSDLWLQGSPARVVGDADSVFSDGLFDLPGAAQAMIDFYCRKLGIELPFVEHWQVARVDVTGNLRLGNLEEVRQALSILRNCEGGRYRVSQTAGDTVYWNNRSRRRSGKAYAKGPHLAYLMRRKDYFGRVYSKDEIELASSLLRLELTLGSQFFHEVDWRTLTSDLLIEQWRNYFFVMVGDADMKTDTDIRKLIMQCASTPGRGKSAYQCWLQIQSDGWERARGFYTKTSWYRHLKLLRAVGLGDSDLSVGQLVPLRRKILEARLVRSWEELRAA